MERAYDLRIAQITGRSEEATRYRRWYGTARWSKLRAYQLSMSPLCERCLASDIVTEATVVHHADGGHRGDESKFWSGPFESLCAAHHNRDGQLEDNGRTVIRYGADGWPL